LASTGMAEALVDRAKKEKGCWCRRGRLVAVDAFLWQKDDHCKAHWSRSGCWWIEGTTLQSVLATCHGCHKGGEYGKEDGIDCEGKFCWQGEIAATVFCYRQQMANGILCASVSLVVDIVGIVIAAIDNKLQWTMGRSNPSIPLEGGIVVEGDATHNNQQLHLSEKYFAHIFV
jgi:hypothetical protein